MFYVYILKSEAQTRYYTGHTKDISRRVKQHNSGSVRSTKAYIPWRVVYTEIHATKQDAYRREMQIKSYKGGGAFRVLLHEKRGGVA